MHSKYRNEKERKREARQSRVRTSIQSSPRVRLTVFRSARHIYAQLDDPLSGKTLGTVSTRSKQISDGSGAIAPLLSQLMQDYAATGLPPAYLPQPQRDEDLDLDEETES